MEQFSLQTSMRDLAFILFKRKWSMIVIFMATMISASVYLFLIRDDLYEVTAKVLVRIGHEQEPPATVMSERPMMIVGQRFQDVNSEADILSSTELLSQVVDELHLDVPGPPAPVPPGLIAKTRYYAKAFMKTVKQLQNEILIRIGFRIRLTPREEAIAMLQKGLLVTPQKDSNVIVAHLFLPTRQYSSAIINKLLELYQNFRLKMFLDQTAHEFFTTEADRIRNDLNSAEKALQDFESQSGIRSIEEQEKELVRQIAEAQTALTAAEMVHNMSAAKAARLEQEMKAEEPDFAALGTFDVSKFPESLMLQLADLRKEREALKLAPLAESAALEKNRKQFGVFMDLLASHLRAALAQADQTRNARKDELAQAQARLDGLHQARMKWNDLKRDAKVLENRFLFYQNKLEQSAATAAMERQRVGNVEIIEHGMDPLAPTGMRKVTLLGMSLVMGLLAALAYASILEFFDHRIYETRSLEHRLNAPVLGVIPAMKRHGNGKRLKRGQPMLVQR
jgi:uncharacterized protein involved in exopolysaccharide biosynthesis